MTYILGISAFYHDSAACLLKDGHIVAAAQEERFTRRKHDEAFPAAAIAYCLNEAGISIKDVSHVVFYEKPFIKFERLLLTYLSYAPYGIASFLKAMPVWLKQKIFIKSLLQEKLGYEGPILFSEHHESHAASAFFPSPFQEAAIITFDGVGEWATTSWGRGRANRIETLEEIHFPHSLGLLYSAFTYYIGFRVNSGEYKLMGLAPYGQPLFADFIKKHLIDIREDGSYRLDMSYFDYPAGLRMTNRCFHDLFGMPPRTPEGELTQKHMDIAASIQAVTEEVILKTARHVHQMTGLDDLCLAGGVALNCVANGKILRETPFKRVWIQPAAGDSGGALGAAMVIWHHYLDKPRCADGSNDTQQGSFLGPAIEKDIPSLAKAEGWVYEHLTQDEIAGRIAGLIEEGKVIGLCQGRMEFGPRALGGRSIIADARSSQMQSVMNLKVKFRESFRPFAPAVLRERVGDYFKIDADSPYMLMVAPVKEDRRIDDKDSEGLFGIEKLKCARSVIPAVTHVDHSARVQTVDKEQNPFFYRIIKAFEERTGCPVVINTSFNIRGEPIVCCAQDAYRCFMCTEMDYLLIEDCLFERVRQPHQERYRKEDISRFLD